jgi:hypothetical protein
MPHDCFRLAGQVLFSVFDPQLTRPSPGVSRYGSSRGAQPAARQVLLEAVWGTATAEQWALEHNSELTRVGR